MAQHTKFKDCLEEASLVLDSDVKTDYFKEDDDCDDDDDDDDDDKVEENREHKLTLGDDISDGDAFGFQQSDCNNYEALAERKRKALTNHQNDGSAKKPRVEDALFPGFDELSTQMNFHNQRKPRHRKKRGRPKGSKINLTPEVSRKLGEANVFYALGQYKDAIHLLEEVVKLAPNLSETYHTLGLVYEKIGDTKRSVNFYMFAVHMAPKDYPFLWKQLFASSLEQGNTGQAKYCLDKAIKADPEDTNLKYIRATLYAELRDYHTAAELYHQIIKLDPDQTEACKMAAKMYHKSNQVERSIGILEDYIKGHAAEVDINVISFLVAMHMENNSYYKAIQEIELARFSSQNQLPIELTVKAGICQIHLGNVEVAVMLFHSLQMESAEGTAELLMEVAEACMNCGQNELALKYYLKLEGNATHDNGFLHLRIAKCNLSLRKKANAITCFYKALSLMEDDIDIRETLASLLIEEGKEAEAITLLSRPEHLDPTINKQSQPWWDCGRIKKQLARIYLAKGMMEEFVDVILSPISETLRIEYSNQKFGPGRRIPKIILSERVKVLENHQDDYIFQGFKPLAAPSELLKAAKAVKMLQKKEALKEERRAATLAAGLDWHSSDDSDDETLEPPREPPLPSLLKDDDHFQLIVDLCKALTSLRRYNEAFKIIRDTREVLSRAQRSEKKEELKSLEAQIAYSANDSIYDHAETRGAVQRQPKSITAWNYYYKIRMNKMQKNSKFLNLMIRTNPECVPALIILGHRATLTNQCHKATRNYLKAYQLQPDNPLINLSVGTALINLALGVGVRNRHQCLAQGFAFLYNNLHLCDNSQEALYNIARAYQHIGLVTLAASYYEKVLSTHEEDYPIPKLPTEDSGVPGVQKRGYCNLRKEAAYNLHLIYKTSGAVDLARQVLRCHCTP